MFSFVKKRASVFTRQKVSKPAFTLIELLVSVAIFSGVVVLALGAFAHSANSSIKSTAVREKTEAARTVVDRIGNDIQYIYTGNPFTTGNLDCESGVAGSIGLHFSGNCLVMILQYPGASDTELVLKRYIKTTLGDKETVFLEEANNCNVTTGAIECDPIRSGGLNDLISDKFVAEGSVVFSGITPKKANQDNTTPLLKVGVTVRPISSNSCSDVPNPCYTIKTSFVPGA